VLDGADLNEGDVCVTFDYTNGVTYVHYLYEGRSDVENSPWVIVPDTNPGTKRWILNTSFETLGHPILDLDGGSFTEVELTTIASWLRLDMEFNGGAFLYDHSTYITGGSF
jgi:hypothetical protein